MTKYYLLSRRTASIFCKSNGNEVKFKMILTTSFQLQVHFKHEIEEVYVEKLSLVKFYDLDISKIVI